MTFQLPTADQVDNAMTLTNVVIAAVAYIVTRIVEARFPLAGRAVAALLARLLPSLSGPAAPANPGNPLTPAVPVPAPAPVPPPVLIPDRPVLNWLLVNSLLPLLLKRHGTSDPAEAVMRELVAPSTAPPAAG